MPGFGRFETVSELASSGPFTVYSARAPGDDGPPKFVVKTFQTTAAGMLTIDDLADVDLVEARAKAFLETAKIQQELAKAAPDGWAPIHDFGRTPSHAYYATDLYDLTAYKLIDSRRDMSPPEVVRLVVAVAAALDAARQARGGRGHGDLKPSNVLIDAPGNDLNQARVFLIDPEPDRRPLDESNADDQRSLADLLHRLVVFRGGPKGGTVPAGPEWAALGKPGEVLRSTCEWLLNPDAGAAPPSTDEIRQRLAPAMVVEKRGGNKKLLIGALAGVVLLGGAAGAWFVLNPPQKKTEDPQHTTNSGGNEDTPIALVEGQNPTDSLNKLIDRYVNQPTKRLLDLEPKVEGDKDALDIIQKLRDQIGGWKTTATDLTDRAAKAWAPIETPQGPNGPDQEAAQKAKEAQIAQQKAITEEFKHLEEQVRGAGVAKSIDAIVDDSLSRLIAYVKDKIDHLDSVGLTQPAARDKLKASLEATLKWLNSPVFDRSSGKFWATYQPQIARLEDYLKTVESGVPAPAPLASPAGSQVDVAGMNAQLASARDGAMAKLISEVGETGQVKDPSEAKAEIDGARQGLEQARADMQSTIDRAVDLERLLGLGYAMDEAGGLASNPKANIASLRQELTQRPDIQRQAVAKVLARVDEIERVAKLSKAPDLIAIIKGSTEPSQLLAAWNALPDAGFPKTVAELADAADLYSTRVAAGLKAIPDDTRRQNLLAAARAPLTRMWIGLAKSDSVSDPGTLAKLFDAMDGCGIAASDLGSKVGPFMAFNYARMKALPADIEKVRQQSPADPKAQVAAIADVLKKFWQRPECAPFKSNKAQAELVRKLQRYEEGKGSVDFATVGPGAQGWQAATPDDEGVRVTYSKGGSSLTFLRITPEDASAATYLATTEMTVGLFAQLIPAADAPKLMTAQRRESAPDDRREGPRTWEWENNSIVPASVPPDQRANKAGNWAMAWGNGWFALRDPAMRDQGIPAYPATLKLPDPPTPQTPINYVGPAPALLAARAAGCRLPTPDEWKLAASAANPADANRRGPEYAEELTYVATEIPKLLAGRNIISAGRPNGQIYQIPGPPPPWQQDNQLAANTADGWLWFRPEQDSQAFSDLVGNVAEYVLDDAGGSGNAPASASGVDEYLKSVRDKVFVIGASALSPPTIAPDAPQPVRYVSAGNGYSDVGFRLAFSAEGGGGAGKPAERLLALLGKAPYLTAKDAGQ